MPNRFVSCIIRWHQSRPPPHLQHFPSHGSAQSCSSSRKCGCHSRRACQSPIPCLQGAQAGPDCEGQEVDVMDFIKCELHWAIFEHKNPLYAPYVMKLILSKVSNIDTSRLTKHAKGTLHQLSKHTKQPSSSRAPPPQSSSEEAETEAPMHRRRSKNADPPSYLQGRSQVNSEVSKLSWWKRKLLCMDVALHKENHASYVREKHIIDNQQIMI